MKNNISNNRLSLYLSPRKDRDLMVELENIEAGDRGWFVKQLMRDGIKYRKEGKTVTKDSPSSLKSNSSMTGESFDELLNLSPTKKEMTKDEAEEKFDML
jgi:hypothetical protein